MLEARNGGGVRADKVMRSKDDLDIRGGGKFINKRGGNRPN